MVRLQAHNWSAFDFQGVDVFRPGFVEMNGFLVDSAKLQGLPQHSPSEAVHPEDVQPCGAASLFQFIERDLVFRVRLSPDYGIFLLENATTNWHQ